MNILLRIINQFRQRGEYYYYRGKYRELRKEVDRLKNYFYHKIAVMEKETDTKLRHLESRIKELEAYKQKAEIAIKMLETLEPDNRKN